MKKLLSVMLIFGAVVAAAEDSYLYWMVGDKDTEFTYNTVKVQVNSGDGAGSYLTIWGDTSLGDSVSKTTADNYELIRGGLYAALGSNPNYGSFVIELWNDSTFVAQSEELPLSTALANYITTNNSMTLPTAWVPQSFAIPEPNSAMLLLLGCAALGLRRRRERRA